MITDNPIIALSSQLVLCRVFVVLSQLPTGLYGGGPQVWMGLYVGSSLVESGYVSYVVSRP